MFVASIIVDNSFKIWRTIYVKEIDEQRVQILKCHNKDFSEIVKFATENIHDMLSENNFKTNDIIIDNSSSLIGRKIVSGVKDSLVELGFRTYDFGYYRDEKSAIFSLEKNNRG